MSIQMRDQVFWANLERLLQLMPATARDEAADFLARPAMPATLKKTHVAHRILDTLESGAGLARVTTPTELDQHPQGGLFRYAGPVGPSGFVHGGSSTAKIKIPPRKKSGPRFEVSLSNRHSLTASVGTLVDLSSSAFLVAYKGAPRVVTPLIAGLSLAGMGESADPHPFGVVEPVDAWVRRAILELKFQAEKNTLNGAMHSEDGSALPETGVQRIVEAVFRSMALDANLSIDPQADHGAGRIDISISRGAQAVCVELKRASHKDLEHGITQQLPKYMESKGARRGHFVVIQQAGDEGEPDELRDRLGEVAGEGIDAHVIDARPRASASRR